MNQKSSSSLGQHRTRAAVPAIEMVDLCKRFGSFQAVDHLSLTVQRGEIFGLLGPNGSGKTTTINMISGLSTPTSDDVHVMGYNVRRQTRQVRRLLGAVPQETALALHHEKSYPSVRFVDGFSSNIFVSRKLFCVRCLVP